MTQLSVNLNRVALLRNSRLLAIPSVTRAATLVLEAGADGVTVHPRPDQRHIRPADVRELAALLRGWPGAEFNIEGNPLHQLMDHVRAVRPQQCTFVPDAPGAATSDHGWDLAQDGERLRPLIAEARALGARVSLFMDAEPAAMPVAAGLGAQRVELYTEPYARAHLAALAGGAAEREALQHCLAQYRAAGAAAVAAGLELNAGHDLNCDNLPDFLRALPSVREVSIGHALIADALEFGLAATVRRYLAALHGLPLPAAVT